MTAAANSSRTNRLLLSIRSGNPRAFEELFARHRKRLRKMIRLRIDPQLRGRIRSSAILEQALQDAFPRVEEHANGQTFYLWLRGIVGERLERVHRENRVLMDKIGGRELNLHRGALPELTAASMAAQLLGDRAANSSAHRANLLLLLEGVLNGMDRLDREILALRNFEEMSAEEAAIVLGMSRTGATVLHLKAVKRLNDILANVPGFFPNRT